VAQQRVRNGSSISSFTSVNKEEKAMKKKLITISDDLFEIIKKNAEASELSMMEEIRQTLKEGVKHRKKGGSESL
jgi:hypothetical protein